MLMYMVIRMIETRLLCAVLLAASYAVPGAALEATGFFRLAEVDGRSWLVSPDGHPFYSLGVCCVHSRGYKARGLGYSPYERNILAKYGSRAAWAKATHKRLLDWGFNTLGAWSSREVSMPFTVSVGFSGRHWLKGKMPDFFAPAFQESVAQRANRVARRYRNDPALVGYFLDNELQWHTDWRLGRPLFESYVALPAEAPGKRALVGFLRKRYGNSLPKLLAVWDTPAESFDALASVSAMKPKNIAKARGDAEAFTYFAARKYFEVTTAALRRADPNHLILGCRFVPWTTPKVVVRACGEFCDAVSVNFYELGPAGPALLLFAPRMVELMKVDDALAEFHRVGRKPVMVTEFSFRAMDSGMPNTWPPGAVAQPTVPTQADRGRKYRHYVLTWASQPYFIGSHWFNYMDEPKQGRWHDGENGNYGLVNEADDPYRVFLDVAKKTNAEAPRAHAGINQSTIAP